MKIALIAGQIHADAQKKVITGVYNSCKNNGDDLHVFALFSSNEEKFNLGELEFINRINFDMYDGFILYSETLYSPLIRRHLLNKMTDYMDRCVFIDSYIDNAVNIISDNESIMEKLVDHLIEEHNVKTINFIAGPLCSNDSLLRQRGVEASLKKHGLKLDSNRVYYGTFFSDSGINAINFFEERGLLETDAFVCANDQMAFGATLELKRLGYNVPDDVLLTGFDNISQIKFYTPSITSVERNEIQIGKTAYESLMQLLETGNVKDIKIEATTKFRNSCCRNYKNDNSEADKFLSLYINKNIDNTRYSKAVNDSSAEFIAANNLATLCSLLPNYLKNFRVPEFCLCIDNDNNSDTINIPIHYVLDDNIITKHTIPRKKIYPKVKHKKDNEGEFLIFNPLHYLDNYFGYTISSDFMLPLQTDLYHSFLSNIGNAIESIYNYDKISQMMKKLQEISLYDSLTGLLNRVGFFEKADILYEFYKMSSEQMYIIFADLDGLKTVNDNLGHKIGDNFICDFANILKECAIGQDLVMRFGGDEFVIFGIGKTKEKAEEQIDNINKQIHKINESKNSNYYPYKLSASFGLYNIDGNKNGENLSLSALIDNADQEMYIKKKGKRCL